MQDRDLVVRIVAGDPEGLAAAYDRYAPALYAYCRTMLHDADDAADALQDTFVVAARKLDGLRDRDRLRPWLYAVARNECLRRIRLRASTVELDQAGEVSDDSVDLEAGVRESEIRDLVRSAFGGLNPGDREVLELSLRHELDGADLGAALGVSAKHAHALLSRARGQLETSLGALLVARTGREDCPELAEILEGWDGELSILLRKRINRHVEHCEVCAERRSLQLRPEALLGALPILLLPPHLRSRIMRMVGDTLPEAVSYREEVSRRAEPFDREGFPVALARPRRPAPVMWPVGGAKRKSVVLSMIVLILLAVLGVGTALAVHILTPTAAAVQVPTSAPPAPTTTYLVTISQSPTQSSPQVTVTATSASPSASASLSLSPSASAAKVSPTPSRSPSASPSRSPSASQSPSPPPPIVLVAAPATATAFPAGAGSYTTSFTLTASGGTVAAYTITVPSPANSYGTPTVSPLSGGPLVQNESVTISVRLATFPRHNLFVLTIQPDNVQVTVFATNPIT
jgi:RNA polymerase sigma factor (sigma-70 family)